MAKEGVEKWENVEEEEEEEVKWAGQYSSMQEILLVGEGDFSFSLSLATTFGTASNIVATSLDTYDALISKYSKAKSNLQSLAMMGATLLHGIDATKMKIYTDLSLRKFDRIVFNFPHAGFKGKEDNLRLIDIHRKLGSAFFKNASRMLRPYGEVHVSHKTKVPFCHWNLEELASKNSLMLMEVIFKLEDYPGYNNKHGDGNRCDLPFRLGKCSTFKFRIAEVQVKKSAKHKFGRPAVPEIDLYASTPRKILGDGVLEDRCRLNGFLGANFVPESISPVPSIRINSPKFLAYPHAGSGEVGCYGPRTYLEQAQSDFEKEIGRRALMRYMERQPPGDHSDFGEEIWRVAPMTYMERQYQGDLHHQFGSFREEWRRNLCLTPVRESIAYRDPFLIY